MLIVEAVETGSLAEQTGVQIGDRVVSYDGRPLPSPTALQALEENTFGKESLLLSLEREGRPLERTVPSGSLGIQTRPDLPDDLLKEYEAGRELFLKGEFAEAARRWH